MSHQKSKSVWLTKLPRTRLERWYFLKDEHFCILLPSNSVIALGKTGLPFLLDSCGDISALTPWMKTPPTHTSSSSRLCGLSNRDVSTEHHQPTTAQWSLSSTSACHLVLNRGGAGLLSKSWTPAYTPSVHFPDLQKLCEMILHPYI